MMAIIKAIYQMLRTTNLSELQNKLKDKEAGIISGTPVAQVNDNGTYRQFLFKSEEAIIKQLIQDSSVNGGAGGDVGSPAAVTVTDKAVAVVTPTTNVNQYYALSTEATDGKLLTVYNSGAVAAFIGDQSDISTGRFHEVPARSMGLFVSNSTTWVPLNDDGTCHVGKGGATGSPRTIDVRGIRKIKFDPVNNVSGDYYTFTNPVSGQIIEVENISLLALDVNIKSTSPDTVIKQYEKGRFTYSGAAWSYKPINKTGVYTFTCTTPLDAGPATSNFRVKRRGDLVMMDIHFTSTLTPTNNTPVINWSSVAGFNSDFAPNHSTTFPIKYQQGPGGDDKFGYMIVTSGSIDLYRGFDGITNNFPAGQTIDIDPQVLSWILNSAHPIT